MWYLRINGSIWRACSGRPRRAGQRAAPGEMGAPAEARYFGWIRLEAEQSFPVKGYSLNAEQILGDAQRARPFIGERRETCERRAGTVAQRTRRMIDT
jgi:hypothetical protein